MQAENIQITLLKLKDGTRLLRLTEPETVNGGQRKWGSGNWLTNY